MPQSPAFPRAPGRSPRPGSGEPGGADPGAGEVSPPIPAGADPVDEPGGAQPAASPLGGRPPVASPWAADSRPSLTPLEDAPWESGGPGGAAGAFEPRIHPRALLFGPVGRRRSLAGLVALSILTLGLYPILWFGRINREMAHFDARVHARPGRSALAVAIPWLIAMGVGAAAGARALLSHLGIWRIDLPLGEEVTRWASAAPLATQYLILLVPFSLVAAVMTLERLRTVEDHLEVATNRQTRPVRALGWLLLPVVGGFALMLKQQRRLNAIWDEFGD